MTRIALVPMASRPYHVGHDILIRLAARECDIVHVYVSTSNRYRKGEALVLGSDMLKVWHEQIEPSLPENVTVSYGGSPVGNVLKELGEASAEKSPYVYVLYADTDDASINFTPDVLKKYAGWATENGHVHVRPVSRSDTVDVSGTQMRKWLLSGDKRSFIQALPKGLDRDAVWDTLHATAIDPPSGIKVTAPKKMTSEALLRQFVRLVVEG